MQKKIYIVAAADLVGGIGKDNALPWHLKGDLKYFHDLTVTTKNPHKQNMVIMGRATWESLPEAHRPLKRRRNIVLSRTPSFDADGAEVAPTLAAAYELADATVETIFIIGGENVYSQAIIDHHLSGIYLTRIQSKFSCDAFFPQIPERFKKVTSLGKETEGEISYEFLLYEKK
jgi:dihydrofolate reductase